MAYIKRIHFEKLVGQTLAGKFAAIVHLFQPVSPISGELMQLCIFRVPLLQSFQLHFK